MTFRWGSRPKCWKTIAKRRRRSSRRRWASALPMSSPSRSTSPAVGSISRVRQRTRVDLPLPDRPITTNTSPWATSKVTSRTATVVPVLACSSAVGRSASGVPTILCSAAPKIFHRPRTEIVGSVAEAGAVISAPEPMGRSWGDVLVDVLRLPILVETGRAELTTDARLLEATPLRLGKIRMIVVDPNGSMPKSPGNPLAAAGVTGPHRAGQAVDRVIADRNGLVLGAEPLDRQDRTEDLLLDDPHLPAAVGEDGRSEEEAGSQLRLGRAHAARDEPGTLLTPDPDIALDLGQVLGRDERAGLGSLGPAVAQPDLLRPAGNLGHECVVDRVLHDRPAAGRADLARMQERGSQGVVDRRLEVGVGEDDVGTLAAQLQGHLLHVPGGRPHDRSTGHATPGKGHEIDGGALGQGRANPLARAEEQVADARGQARLGQQAEQVDRGQRRDLGRLEDEGVARSEGGSDLPGRLQERVVPG